MICLNEVFAGKRFDVMDVRFPDTDWRRKLAESKAADHGDWGWFWRGFAPHGMIMNTPRVAGPMIEERPIWKKEDMGPAVLKACAEGLLESSEPTAFLRLSDGRIMYYWIFSESDGKTRPGEALEVSV